MENGGNSDAARRAVKALRSFLRAKWELRDPSLFISAAPPAGKPKSANPAPKPAPQAPRTYGQQRPSPRAAQPPSEWKRPPGAPPARKPPQPSPERHKSGIISPESSEKGRSLLEFYEKIRDCRACQLGATRTNFVFGCGNPESRVVFVGEAPGEHEDRQGLPFVGLAGQLLTRMLEASGIPRDSVFICNVLKCRPPGNRQPEIGEIEECEPHLKEQLRLIKPLFVVALGTFAAQSILRTQRRISQLRGRWYSIDGIEILPTFHPSACLRSPAYKKELEADLFRLKSRLQETDAKGRKA